MTTVKNPAQIRKSGSLEYLLASRYAPEPKAAVLTYIWACDESAITGDEVRTCKVWGRPASFIKTRV